MEEALEKLPLGLEEAFEETLKRVRMQPDGQVDVAINTLMWLTHTRRPMLIAELSEALAIRLGTNSLNSKYCPWPKRIVDCSMGLTVMDEHSTVIRLVHYSVQEHLYRHRERIFGKAEEDIAQKCLTYLLFEPFARGPRQLEVKIQDLVAENPFATYAARYWGDHVRAANTDELEPLTLKFLQAKAQRGCSYQIVRYTGNYREEYWKAEEANSVNGLHLAAAFGLDRLGQQLLDAGQVGVDDPSHIGSTALIRAAAGGHREFVRMLLHRAADTLKENWYGTALHCAAEAGKIDTILELVDNGIDVDLRDRRGRTSLHCATVSGHGEAMKTLLSHGADVNAVCNKNYTALRYAIVWEQASRIVQILLENGADTSILSNHSVTPLHDAAVMNSEETLLLLLRHKADVNANEAHRGTPLHFAAERNHVAIVQHLLRFGADVHAKTTDDVTALYLAAGNGGAETATALIEAGADVEVGDNDFLTPLGVAVRENRVGVVSVLLAAGANPEAEDEEGYTPLQVAAREGYQAIAKLLQDAGAKSPSVSVGTPYQTKGSASPASSSSDEISHTPSKLAETKISTQANQQAQNDNSPSEQSDGPKPENASVVPQRSNFVEDYRAQARTLARDLKQTRRLSTGHKQASAPATSTLSMTSSASPSEPRTFFCQEKDCSYSDRDEDRYKQHMENVHGWIHVKHRALDDLRLPE